MGSIFFKLFLLFVVLNIAGPLLALVTGQATLFGDWRAASRESSGIAPIAAEHPGALVHVYGARAFKWRGAFAIHSWIAYKPEGAESWTTLQVTGWRQWRGLPVIAAQQELPDRLWYDQKPELLGELKGDVAARAIDKIIDAAKRYPWPETYTLWPGPNSNTFIAWVSREVPELKVNLPVTAIGKDFLSPGKFVAPAPSNTGWQLSLGGVLGFTVARVEGLEINWAGTGIGIDFLRPAIKLPGIGRLGISPHRR